MTGQKIIQCRLWKNSHFKKLQRHLHDHTQSLTSPLPFSFFPFTPLPVRPQHVKALKENKNLKLINIPAYHLAGSPAVW